MFMYLNEFITINDTLNLTISTLFYKAEAITYQIIYVVVQEIIRFAAFLVFIK
jgi:hypothetical protein